MALVARRNVNGQGVDLVENDVQGEWALPDGWVWTTLGEITEPSKEKINPQEIQRTPYVGLEHIEKGTGKLLGFGYSDEVRSTKAAFHRGDLLYGKLRPYLNKVHLADFDGICSTDILVFPRNPHISNRFLLYRLLSGDFVRYANLNVSGVQHPRTNFKVLSQFLVAFPPATEQRRIVAEIETQFTRLDAAVAALERAQANLRRYKASVLKAACEGRLVPTEASLARAEGRDYEPADQLLARILAERRAKWEANYLEKQRAKGKEPKDDRWKQKYKEPAKPNTENLPELPEGWSWTTVDQVSQLIQYGTSQKADLDPSGIPVLRMGNIQGGELDFGNLKYLPLDYPKIDDFLLQPGDVLFNRTNSAELVGKTAVYKGFHPRATFASYLIKVQVLEGFSPDFLSFYINSVYGRQYIVSVISQQVGQANVNGTKLRKMTIPLPPLPEQRRIVAEVERRLSVVTALEASVGAALARARRLRQAVLKQAFEGRLVPQHPDDEPASVLLERIRAEKARREGKGKDSRRSSRKKKQQKQMELF